MNRNKIKKEIEAAGLRVELYQNGLLVHPNDDSIIHSAQLKKLIRIVYLYDLGCYINFELGFIRIYNR